MKKKNGTLIIVGGREDKQGDRVILKEIVRRTGRGKLVVATLASRYPREIWKDYREVFSQMGVKHLEHLEIETAEQARDPEKVKILQKAATLYFTGGDQLMITSKIGGTPLLEKIFQLYRSGGTVAGTSAGAAVMGDMMLMGLDANEESHKVGQWMMARGLGFVPNLLIDQHFAQRSRIGRLLRAVALNPGILGIGIDEDTSILVERSQFQVLGRNAVYVIDGSRVTSTNISEAAAEKTMSMHDVRLHILSNGEVFDLKERHPLITQASFTA